ncbi:MAG: hypothetical protein ACJLUP_16720 [Agrobacterium tumefaciens]
MTAQKVSTAVGLGLVALVGTVSIWASNKERRETEAVNAPLIKRYNDLLSGSEPASARSQRAVDYAFSDWNTFITITNDADLRKRIRPEQIAHEHINKGAAIRYPLSQKTLVQMFDLLCDRNAGNVSAVNNFDMTDVRSAWNKNTLDVANIKLFLHSEHLAKAQSDCEDRFRLLIASYENRKTPAEEAGEAVGKVKNSISDAWSSVTEPISKQLDEFRAGYQSQ